MAASPAIVDGGLSIARARLSGRGASRALLEAGLGAVALEGLGLGPDEVLYVPRLAAPARLRPGEGGHFARGVGLALGEIARGAERDPVDAGAAERPCRFTSRAAFAAWLIGVTLDGGDARAEELVRAATGSATPRGWWRGEVLADARRLVPVLDRLANIGRAARWLARLDATEIAMAAAALARDYAMPAIDAYVLPAPARTLPAGSADRAAPSRAAERPRRRAGAQALVDEIRDAIATRGEPLGALPRASRRLLVAALALARAPGVPRAALARAVEDVISAELVSPPPLAADARAPTAGATTTFARADGGAVVRPQVASVVEPLPRHRLPRVVVVAPFSRADAASARAGAAPQRGENAPGLVRSADPVPVTQPASTPRDVSPAPVGAPESMARTAAPGVERLAFDTAFGGLAFLVNAFVAMGFYPDFTRPLDPALGIAPLVLADRLGRHWFGARYARDPLHRWLSCDRSGELPRRWRVARDWLEPFPGGRCRHARRTLWHSAGFPLADGLGEATARGFARSLGLALGRAPRATARRAARRDPDWLESLALFLAARFRRAAPDRALTPAALAIPARVVAVADRLDVHFELARLPIVLRIAGLDRDPGWLPAEGRDLRFHFA